MVLEDARRHLDALAPLAQQLNDKTDEFTKELKAIEVSLQQLNLGLDVTVKRPLIEGPLLDELDEGDPLGMYRVNSYLSYGRCNQVWRVLVRTYRDYEQSDDVLIRTTPLVDASRDVRLAAAERMKDLLELLAAEAQQRLTSLNKATDPKRDPKRGVIPPMGEDDKGSVHLIDNATGKGLCGAEIVAQHLAPESKLTCADCASVALYGSPIRKTTIIAANS